MAASKRAASAAKRAKKKASKKVSKKKAAKKATSKKKAAKKATSSKKKAAKKATSKKKATSSKKKATKKATSKKKAAKKATTKKKAAKKATTKKKAAKKASLADTNSVAASGSAPGVGDAVPTFALADQAGQPVSNESLRGAPYVLYFYPKDNTPGCTKEACGFNDELAQFEQLGVKIVGVSPDGQRSHESFIEKYGLKFTLLSDTDNALSNAMGVYQLKKNYGREYMGIVRSTFLVNAEGVIAEQWRGVRVAGHVPAVLEAAGGLS